MKTFKSYVLNERFINLFIDDKEKRYHFADDIWDMLQKSYADIGGLKGNGFKDKKDMIDNIPFWKIATISGKPVAVVMFKDKGGRKRIVMGAAKVQGAKAKVVELMMADLNLKRSWSEISGPAWGFLKKNVPIELIQAALVPIKTVQKLQPTKEITPAFGNDPTIKSNDPFRDFWYQRQIGQSMSTKIAVGNPGNKIF